MAKIRNDNFYTVLGWMLNVLELKGNELIVFAIVYSFSQDGESEWKGSLSFLESFANISHPTAVNCLNSLCERNLIKRREYKSGRREDKSGNLPRVAYSVNFDEIDKIKADVSTIKPNNKD